MLIVTRNELPAVLDSERMSALSSDASKLSSERAKAMRYYQGNMEDDLPTDTDHSSAVSTDVSDTIEGLMPDLMDIFAGGDEVVRFEPTAAEDVEPSQQETDYVNHVFMQQNPGFMILYQFVKDALLNKTGIVKVAWEDRWEETEEEYNDIDDQQFMVVVSQPGVQVIQHTVKPMPDDGPDTEPAYDEAVN